jgi:DNA-binding HxlR family transcriptional regulator
MVAEVKTYKQRCPLARALDVVGERWSMLVVRELTLGPRRYSDLLDGLPGIPTNLLVTRLKDLQAAGIVTKRKLPPPTAVTVYELTEAGNALRPALAELRAWGAHYGPAPAETDTARPSWVLMSASNRPTALPGGRTCELRIGDEFFHVSAIDFTLKVHGGPARSPDAVITMPAETLYHLTHAKIPAHKPAITGDPAIADAVLATLGNIMS